MNKFKEKLGQKVAASTQENTSNVKKNNHVDLLLNDLTILPKFRDLLPKPSESERLMLKERLKAEGWKEPIDVWDDRANDRVVLIDGHNRMEISEEIAKETGSTFKPKDVKKYDFDSEDKVVEWILEKNFARRSLTTNQKSIFRGLEFNSRKGDRGHGENLSKTMAEKYGVSESTINKDAALVRKIKDLDKALIGVKLFELFKNGKTEITKTQVDSLYTLLESDKKALKNLKSIDDINSALIIKPPTGSEKKDVSNQPIKPEVKQAVFSSQEEVVPIIEESFKSLKKKFNGIDIQKPKRSDIKETIDELSNTIKQLRFLYKSIKS